MFKIKNKKLRKLTCGLGIGLIVALFSTILTLSNPFNIWHLKATNSLYTKNQPSEEIIIIAIDSASIDRVSNQGLGKFYEWRRTLYANALENLEEAEASVIGIDVLFTERSKDIPQEKIDEIFDRIGLSEEKAIINEVSKLALDYTPFKTHPDDEIFNEVLSKYDNIILAAKSRVDNFNIQQADLPYQPFRDENLDNIGFIDAKESPDQTIREVPLQVVDDNNNAYDSFALKVAQKYTNNEIDPSTIPTNNGKLIINYQANPFAFKHLSFKDVLKGNFDPSDLKDKIVLIGVTDSKLGDQFPTPKSSDRFMPGVEIHANAIQTLLEKKFLVNQSKTSQTLTIFALAIIGSLALIFLNIWFGIALAIALFFAYYKAAHAAYSNGVILNMVYPFIIILLTYMSSIIYKYFAELKTRKYIQTAFGRYLSPTVMKEVLKNPHLLHRSGMRREITVFFSDIAGFTGISETLDPRALIDLINDYLGTMTDIILKHEGTLDKYVGDAIVAYFGAPMNQPNHAKLACQVALEMRETLPSLHEKWKKEGKPLIDFRIGINTGNAIVGNVGSEKHFDYTIMGDEVNLGSRLEGANKKYNTRIMLSQATYNQVKDDFIFRKLDYIRVKGKHEAIHVYELVAHRDRVSEAGGKLLETYNKAMDLYQNRQFQEAYEGFKKALTIYPEDGPSKLYLQRSEILRDYPPPDDWDGVFSMKTK